MEMVHEEEEKKLCDNLFIKIVDIYRIFAAETGRYFSVLPSSLKFLIGINKIYLHVLLNYHVRLQK